MAVGNEIKDDLVNEVIKDDSNDKVVDDDLNRQLASFQQFTQMPPETYLNLVVLGHFQQHKFDDIT